MKYYHPALFPKEPNATVRKAFEDGYALVFVNTHPMECPDATSSIPTMLMELAWMVGNPFAFHIPVAINYGNFANAYGFESPNSFVLYAYMLWKHNEGVFAEELSYISDRVRVTTEEESVSGIPLDEWFQHCYDNGTCAVLEACSAVLGQPKHCVFQSLMHRRDVSDNLKDVIMVVRPGGSITNGDSLAEIFTLTIEHVLTHYTPKPHEDYPYEFYCDLIMERHGTPSSISERVDMVEFEIVDVTLTAHRYPAGDREQLHEVVTDELYWDLKAYYGRMLYYHLIMYKDIGNRAGTLGQFHAMYQNIGIKQWIDARYHSFPEPFTFEMAIDTKTSKKLVFNEHNADEFYDLFRTLSGHDMAMRVDIKVLNRKIGSQMVYGPSAMDDMKRRMDVGKHQLHVATILFNDLRDINYLKLRNIMGRGLTLNLERIDEAYRAVNDRLKH